MSPDFKQLEIDRLRNMVQAFGWSVTNTLFLGDKAQVKFEKTLATGQESTGKVEADRVVNLVSSFGWQTISREEAGNKLTVQFEKVISGSP